ncbi:MAG: alpha/beta fold hydrolase [bacterium]
MKKLLLLHGAIGSSVQLEPLAKKLEEFYKVSLLNFSGHGGKEIPDEMFSIEMFAEDVLYFIEKNRLEGINVFGYSMGGYVALYIAKNFPGKVNKIFTIATKFDWTEESSIKESKLLNPDRILQKIPKFAEQLRQRHLPEDWKAVLSKTSEMMLDLGRNNRLKNADLEAIENEVQLSVGDEDTMVTIEETVNAYRHLKNGKLLIIPDTPHPIEKISVDRLTYEIRTFFG